MLFLARQRPGGRRVHYLHGTTPAPAVNEFELIDEIVAALALSGRGLRESLVTRNRLESGPRIALTLVEGPFRHFEGLWTFTPVGHGCRIHLELAFDLKSGLLDLLGAPLLNRVADGLVDAFSRRAGQQFGGGG